MVIDMNEARLDTIEQIREFLAGTADVAFTVPPEEAKLRQFVVTVLRRFRYFGRAKGQRGVLFAYMQRLTGYSRQHLSRLVAQYRDTQSLRLRDRASRTSFARKYSAVDVALLAELDTLHDTLSGPATKVLAQRAYRQFGDLRYARLQEISVSHLYSLRASESYRKQRLAWQKTRPSPITIGVRKAPAPQGLPGYIRIDTVHQGDLDGAKGVYHINAVDIVTQWQLCASGRHKRRYKATTDSRHSLPVAPNRLAQNFETERPDQVWTADITYRTPIQRSPPEWGPSCLSMSGMHDSTNLMLQ